MPTVEYFYDYSSPWTFYACQRVQDLCKETGAELIWKPFLVGGVFNKVNPSVYQRRENPIPAKDAYYAKDGEDWARYLGIKKIKPSVFPLNSVKSLRGAFYAIEEGKIAEYSKACFEAYWTKDIDISKDDNLAEIVESVGLDKQTFFAKIADQAYKQKLIDSTDELIARGGYGSPTFFINKTDMYFGNDRIELMRFALTGKGHQA